MLELPSLITGARRELGLPERPCRGTGDRRAAAHMVQKHELGSVGLKALGVLTKLGLQF